MLKKFMQTKKMAILIILLQSIIVIYSIHFIESFKANEFFSYHLKDELATTTILGKGQNGSFILHSNYEDVVSELVLFHSLDCSSGSIGYSVYNEKGEYVVSGEYQLSELRSNGGILIDLQQEKNTVNREYKLVLQSNLDYDVSFDITREGYIDTSERYENKWGNKVQTIVVIVNIFIFIMFILLVYIKRTEMKFAVMSFSVAILAVVTIIPCSAPDEWRHFLRAYNIAQGSVSREVQLFNGTTTKECEIPKELYAVKDLGLEKNTLWTDETNWNICIPKLVQLIKSTKLSGDTVFSPMHATYRKTILEYFPQVIFILFGKLLGCNSIGIFYLARLGNVLISTLIGIWAVCLAPRFKYGLMALFFVPEMSFLRATSSTDGILFSVCLLLLAYILYVKDMGKSLFKFQYVIPILLLGTYISFVKLPYILLLGLIIILEEANFENKYTNKRQELFIKAGYIIVCIMICMIARAILLKILAPPSLSAGTSYIVSVFSKIKAYGVWTIFSLYFRTVFEQTVSFIIGGTVTKVGGLTNILFISYLAAFIASVRCNGSKIDIKVRQRIWMTLLALCNWFLIVMVFLAISNIPSGEIWGIQGRYITPLFIFVAIAMTKTKGNEIKKRSQVMFLPLAIFAINMLQFVALGMQQWC